MPPKGITLKRGVSEKGVLGNENLVMHHHSSREHLSQTRNRLPTSQTLPRSGAGLLEFDPEAAALAGRGLDADSASHALGGFCGHLLLRPMNGLVLSL